MDAFSASNVVPMGLAAQLREHLERIKALTPEQRAELDAIREREQSEMVRAARFRYLRRRSRLEGLDWDRTLEVFRPATESQAAALRQVREISDRWLESPRSVILWGDDFGDGKSHLAKGLLMELLDKGVPGVFWREPEFRQALTESRFMQLDVESPVSESRRAKVVVLDDLDKWFACELGQKNHADLWGLVDWLYDQGRQLIVTSQFPRTGGGASLQSIFGGSFADRLSHAVEIEVRGPSARTNQRSEQNGKA